MDDAAPAVFDDLLRHGRFVRRVVRGVVAGPDVDDAVQETWMAALKRPPQAAGGLGGWLATVARNAARKLWRGEDRRRRREEAAAKPEAAPSEAALIERERRIAELLAAIGRLDATSRRIVHGRFYEGLSAAELGDRLGLSPGAVRTRLSRALDAVRDDLDAADGGRAAWTAALAPLGFPGLSVAAAAELTAATAAASAAAELAATTAIGTTAATAAWTYTFGGLLMAKKLIAATLVVAAAAVSAVMLRNDDAPRPDLTTSTATAESPPAAPPPAEIAPPEAARPVAASPFRDEERFEDEGAAVRATRRPVRVVGQVVDEGKRPVVGATVRLRADAEFGLVGGAAGPAVKPSEAVTDAVGRFALDAPAGGDAEVRVRPAVLADVTRRFSLPTSGEVDLGQLTAPPGAQVSGVVRDDQGRAIAGADVSAAPASDSGFVVFGGRDTDAQRATKTDAAGRYALAGVTAGSARIEAWSEDRPPVVKDGVVLTAGGAASGVDFVLKDGATIEGVVRDESGRPVADARVRAASSFRRIEDGAPRSRERRTNTDAEGRFTLRGLAPGEHQVSARKAGYVGASGHASPGGEAAVLGLKTSGGIFGRVAGPDGSFPEKFQVVITRGGAFGYFSLGDMAFTGPAAVKILYGAEAARALGESETNGWWFAPDVPYETGAVRVSAEGAVPTEFTEVAIPAGKRTRHDVKLEPERVLRGTVVDAEGRPVPGAVISVAAKPPEQSEDFGAVKVAMTVGAGGGGARTRVVHPGEEVGRSVAAADGSYSVRGIPDGEWIATASARGHLNAAPLAVVFAAGTREAEAAFRLGAAGAIAGRLLDSDGAPLAGVSIQATPRSRAGENPSPWPLGESFSGPRLTDRDGKFRIEGLAPGEYVVAARPKGGSGPDFAFSVAGLPGGEEEKPLQPGEVLALVVARQTAEVELRMPKPAGISGYVTEAGKAAAGVVVRLESDAGGGGGFVLFGAGPKCVTDERGFFQFLDRAAGKYTLALEPEGAPEAIRRPVELVEGRGTREDVALPTGRIDGRVVDEAGLGVAGARVQAKRKAASSETAEGAVIFTSAIGGLAGGDGDDGDGAVVFSSYGARSKHVTTDADGRYTLKYLAAGEYGVTATHDAYSEAKIDGVAVAEGGVAAAPPLAMQAAGSVEVTVQFPAGSQDAWAVVELVPEKGETVHFGIDPDGKSTRKGLRPGTWTCSVRFGDAKSEERRLEVRAGETTRTTFRL